MHITASAPGKLVLLGEYAVLFGHPSLVMAVNRRARVEVVPSDDASWRVSAPGFCGDEAHFDLDSIRGFAWRAPDSHAARQLVLVERVLHSLVKAELLDPDGLPPATITLNTDEFFLPVDTGRAKLGLGSSAALTVAITKAVRSWDRREQQKAPLDLGALLELHRSFQGGRGSGIDLAASLRGGVTEYLLEGDDKKPDARGGELPAELEVVHVWTGRSASTADFLARLEQGMRSDGAAIEAALGELGRVATAGINHLRSGDTGGFLDDVDGFSAAMQELGHTTGIPVVSEEHLRLQELAKASGVRYKPSGAGGGDVGLGFTDDPEAAAAFARQAAAAGFTLLDLHIDPKGVRADNVRVG